MRIISIMHDDYACFGYENTKAMQSVGLDAQSFALRRHTFYIEQSQIISADRMKKEIEKADIIQVMHSCGTSWDMVKEYAGKKKIIVWHTGTRYRTDPKKHNERWNPIADKIIIALGEFENLGAKNPEFFSITKDVETISKGISFEQQKEHLVFAHYPSNPSVKGTPLIVSAIDELKREENLPYFEFNYSNVRCDINKQLSRMNNCDVYIELFAPEQGGNPYGSFGTTAIEAAALGKIVISNMLWRKLYEEKYASLPLFTPQTKDGLKQFIRDFINMDKELLKDLKYNTFEWALRNHSYKASGERMKRILSQL